MPMPSVKNAALLETAFAVRKAVFIMDKLVDKALAEKGDLTLMQMMVLRTIEVAPRITQRELAGVMNLTEAAVSRQIEVLLKRKMVAREKIPDERRAMALTLTEDGAKELLDALAVGYEVIERYYEQIPEQDRQTVKRSFDGMNESLKEHCYQPNDRTGAKSDSIA